MNKNFLSNINFINRLKLFKNMIIILGLVFFILYLNFPLQIKQLFLYGVEEFKEKVEIENSDDNFKMNIPIYKTKDVEDKQHPGYCFIGDPDSTRHCVELLKDDTCVSGQIYKTKEICVNPDLRY